MLTVFLLVLSNVFMTFAWYGHLRFRHSPLWIAILASWGIAFFEYCLQVPANRLGYGQFSAFQLKVIQETVTIVVFIIFAFLYLGTTPRWNHLAAFLCIIASVGFAFLETGSAPQ